MPAQLATSSFGTLKLSIISGYRHQQSIRKKQKSSIPGRERQTSSQLLQSSAYILPKCPGLRLIVIRLSMEKVLGKVYLVRRIDIMLRQRYQQQRFLPRVSPSPDAHLGLGAAGQAGSEFYVLCPWS